MHFAYASYTWLTELKCWGVCAAKTWISIFFLITILGIRCLIFLHLRPSLRCAYPTRKFRFWNCVSVVRFFASRVWICYGSKPHPFVFRYSIIFQRYFVGCNYQPISVWCLSRSRIDFIWTTHVEFSHPMHEILNLYFNTHFILNLIMCRSICDQISQGHAKAVLWSNAAIHKLLC